MGGLIVTFYSYKGGVGRTMALANIAVLLSRMGRRVLIVDWDLEAPGLDQYFKKYISLAELSKPGLLDLFLTVQGMNSNSSELTWRDLITEVDVEGRCPISLITSGQKHDKGYIGRVVQFNWENFFSEFDGGEYIEKLRNEWREEFDLVLIDSRTGITDSGGVCTIQMPDVLVLVFTANSQSIDGIKEIALSAQKARQNLAYDRGQVLFFPLLSRFDSRAEFEVSQRWLKYASESLVDFYDWLPKNYSPYDFLEQTKLPHIAHFSFGEGLPAVDQRITDPEGLSYAYQKTAELLANKFDQESIRRVLGGAQSGEYSIFLSYARADGQAATRLKAELERAGFKIWRDIEDVQGGQAWKERLRAALRTVDVVVVLLTPAAVASRGVEWEWENAITLEKRVIPLLMLPCDVPTELKKIHYHNLSTEQDYVMGITYLLRDLNLLLADKSVPEDFIQDLEETGRISIWINTRRKAFSNRFGHEALKAFPDIENTADSDRISYFFFSIDQFLEQVSHCLKWGRYDILDSPGIPLVLDHRVYEVVFSLIKETIEKDLPQQFNKTGRRLASDCIDYLISQLPFYEQE